MYDLRYLPVTFDCATYLVGANAARQVMGLESMHVHVLAHSFRRYSERDLFIKDEEKRWRAHHIVLQVAHLLPSTVVTYSEALPEYIGFPIYPAFYQPNLGDQLAKAHLPLYSLKYISEFTKKGADLRPFKCPDINPAGRLLSADLPLITVSLRTSKFQPSRNSNLTAWAKLTRRLKEKGYRVVVIPDFEDVVGDKLFAKHFQSSDVSIEASCSLLLRARLYESAIQNFGVVNGIMSLLIHSKSPYSIFKIITDGINTTSIGFLKERLGLDYNTKPIFSDPTQNWIWENDEVSVLLKLAETIGF
jgi:hypothetical protein